MSGAALGLGQGFTFGQDIIAAKVRLFGDAVYAQDTAGSRRSPSAPTGSRATGTTLSPRWALRTLEGCGDLCERDQDPARLVDPAERHAALDECEPDGSCWASAATNKEDHEIEAEASVGWLVNRYLLVGGEYRMKPDNLGIARGR